MSLSKYPCPRFHFRVCVPRKRREKKKKMYLRKFADGSSRRKKKITCISITGAASSECLFFFSGRVRRFEDLPRNPSFYTSPPKYISRRKSHRAGRGYNNRDLPPLPRRALLPDSRVIAPAAAIIATWQKLLIDYFWPRHAARTYTPVTPI